MFNIPAWSLTKNVYHYHNNNSPRLLITVGDSWTWGDSLGKTKVRIGHDDAAYRLRYIYGAVMQRKLGCNWVNIALPGGSNTLMLDWLQDFLPNRGPAAHVDCVITLTESGRHEELNLIDKTWPTQQYALTQILAHTYNKIERLQVNHPNVNFIVAHNFTDGAKGIIPLCDQSWLEVLLDQQIQKNTHIVVSEHIEQMNYQRRFPDVLDIITRAEQRIDLLDSCNYCNREDSRHPTEQGHSLWANYLLNKLS